MTALTHPSTSSNLHTDPHSTARDQANRWLVTHYDELVRRAKVRFARLNPEAREEAVAEALAFVTTSVHAAARNGNLHRLCPATCIHYAARQFHRGRRVAGYTSRCPLSEAGRHQHDHRVLSLDQPCGDEDDDFDLHMMVPDARADDPSDGPRRRLDIPHLLDREHVSAKARATFRYLAETHGNGPQTVLAKMLGVTPARITQLKRELAAALATDGYASPLGSRLVG